MAIKSTKISESDVSEDDISVINRVYLDSTGDSDGSEDTDESSLLTSDDDVKDGENLKVSDEDDETSDCSTGSGSISSTSEDLDSNDESGLSQSSDSTHDSEETDESGVVDIADDSRRNKLQRNKKMSTDFDHDVDYTDSSDTSLIFSDDESEIKITDETGEGSDSLEDESENSDEDSGENDSEYSENEEDENTSDDGHHLYDDGYSNEEETDHDDIVDTSSSDVEEPERDNPGRNMKKYTIKCYNTEIIKIIISSKKGGRKKVWLSHVQELRERTVR